MLAMHALKALPWFSASVRDIRAFRVEQWSDFTGFMRTH
jgi:virulence-associated protein VapD